MRLESHATPLRTTPQQRYANLHRAIERGLGSDEVWKELADVSLHLGHREEAVRCLAEIRGAATRQALEARLVRLGLLEPAEDHSEASAASHAETQDDQAEHDLVDHVVDALQYQLHQHMPWVALVTMLAFPLVIGVGGFLTAGGSLLLLAAIAALPGLCVLGVVGAMGRQVLAASAEGHAEVPPLPGFTELLNSARRFAADAGLVLGTLIAPGALAIAIGVPLQASLPLLLAGAFLAPMAWVLRYLRGDGHALHPKLLVEAIRRTMPTYLGLAPITVGLFVPAAIVVWATLGRPVWVQIAVVGPLCVLPVFVAARLLGTWLEANRRHLGDIAVVARPPETRGSPAPVAAQEAAPRLPKRPQALEQFVAPTLGRTDAATPPATARAKPTSKPTSKPTPKPTPKPKAKPPTATPAKASPGAAGTEKAKPATPAAPRQPATPAPRPAAPAPVAGTPAPTTTTAARPARPAPKAIAGHPPSPRHAEAPVLKNMPFAVVVTGADRKRQGAAARRP